MEYLVGTPKEAHPLLQPKPTSFQLYLEQQNSIPDNWDTSRNLRLRGYKLYWHNTAYNWESTPEERQNNINVISKMQPIKAGSKFHSRIRFQNLNKEELGALLMVFDLSGNSPRSAYKIGKGKSLGLGSIRITSKLKLDTPEMYHSFFHESRITDDSKETSMDPYLKAFTDHIESNGMTRAWQEVMNELVKMLDWKHAEETPNWSEKVASMSGNVQTGNVDHRFVELAILPKVRDVY